uniref:Uncharacterized protein n=1 Tax=Rhizophora mucronata TaxID=61149 RepID=A0A2P2JDB5_RHIMU
MAMQAAVSSPKVLLIVGAGVSCSIILRHGNFSELIEQLHKLLEKSSGVDMESIEDKTALLAAQVLGVTFLINVELCL